MAKRPEDDRTKFGNPPLGNPSQPLTPSPGKPTGSFGANLDIQPTFEPGGPHLFEQPNTEVDRAAFGSPQQAAGGIPEGFGQPPATEPQVASQQPQQSGNWTEGWRDYQASGIYDEQHGPPAPTPSTPPDTQVPTGADSPPNPFPSTNAPDPQTGPPDPFPRATDPSALMGPPDPFPSTEPMETGFVGPTQPTEQESRRFASESDQQRLNEMLTERARARRGLPPLNEAARAAAMGGPEAAKAYRQGPDTSAYRYEAMGGTAGAPQQYRTGEVVQLQGMPGGQESTRVYSMGGGITLPDGQGMSSDDFVAAFKQLNPGKSPVDAIQSLAREPGPTGAAARTLLRDIGSSGGASLSESQRQQLEDQLSSRGAELLSTHARSMERGIDQGSAAIRRDREEALKAQEAERKKEADIRKAALTKAQERFAKAQAAGEGRSFDSFLEEEVRYQREAQQFVAGEGGPPQRRIYAGEPMDVTYSQVSPDRLPADAVPEGMRFQNGRLQYLGGSLNESIPGVVIQSEKTASGQLAVPVISNDRQKAALPPGQPFIENGMLYPGRGVPGRPSAGGETTGRATATRTTPKADTAEGIGASLVSAREELERQRNKQFNEENQVLINEIERARDVLLQGTGGEQFLATQKERLDSLRSELEERRKAMPEITPEEVRAKVEADRRGLSEATKIGQDILFQEGDPEAFASGISTAMPENAQMFQTASGPVMSVGDTDIPMAMVGETPVPDPQNASQIAALERSARGNAVVASMGKDAIGVVSSDAYKESSEQRQGLAELASSNPEVLLGTERNGVLEKIDEYITTKYPNLEQSDRPQIARAVAESLGFRTQSLTSEEIEARRQSAGLGPAYAGREQQVEATRNNESRVAASVFLRDFEQRFGAKEDFLRAGKPAGPEVRSERDWYAFVESTFVRQQAQQNIDKVQRKYPGIPYAQAVELANEMAEKSLVGFETEMESRGYDVNNYRRSPEEIARHLTFQD